LTPARCSCTGALCNDPVAFLPHVSSFAGGFVRISGVVGTVEASHAVVRLPLARRRVAARSTPVRRHSTAQHSGAQHGSWLIIPHRKLRRRAGGGQVDPCEVFVRVLVSRRLHLWFKHKSRGWYNTHTRLALLAADRPDHLPACPYCTPRARSAPSALVLRLDDVPIVVQLFAHASTAHAVTAPQTLTP
jgi:hypothetical protein